MFTDKVHFDVLSPVIPLASNRYELALKESAAKIFGAFRVAAEALQNYYKQQRPPITGLHFPYQRDFAYRSHGSAPHTRTFRYQQQLYENQLIFSAILTSDEDAMEEDAEFVIIKFVRRYSEEAHDYCADQGYSPRFLGYEKLVGY